MITAKSIVFFYPSRILGGAEYLFIRLSRFLAERGFHVFYVDYSDGFARKELAGTDVVFWDFKDGEKTPIDAGDYLITPLSNFYRLPDYVDLHLPRMRLFFWSLHPYNVVHVLPECKMLMRLPETWYRAFLSFFFPGNYKRVRGLLNDLNKADAIWFMDEPNLSLNYSLWKIPFSNDCLLPPPLETAEKDRTISAFCPDRLRIAILGRLSHDKIYSVINVLDRFLDYRTARKRVCHIIGDGDAGELISKEKYNAQIEILFHASLKDHELDAFLTENVDVLFAMGMSCLAGASLGIPVVQINYGFSPYASDHFHFLYDTQGFSLGGHYKKTNPHDRAFQDVLDSCLTTEQKRQTGQACKDYFLRSHGMKAVADKMLANIAVGGLDAESYLSIRKMRGKLKKRNKPIHNIFALFQPKKV